MTISVNLTDTPVGVTVSANAGAVSVSAATVTAVQVGIGETSIPATHGGTHASGGSDPVTLNTSQIQTGGYPGSLSAINNLVDRLNETNGSWGDARANVIDCADRSHTHAASDIASGTIATARLGSGTASASTYLRGDQTWASISTYTLPAATTSTLGGVIVGTGLGVSSGTVSVTYGTTSGTACQGNDSRLSDARTPTGAAGGDLTGTYPNPTLTASGATAGTYKSVTVDTKGRVTGGTNPTTLAGYGITDAAASTHTHSATAIASGTLDTARLASGAASSSTYLRGDQTWASIPSYTLPNATTSTLGGVIVGAGLGVTAGTLRVTYGTATGSACQGDDSRLSNSRTPTGAAGGDLAGTYPNPTLAITGVGAGTYKSVTVDARGRVTGGSNPTTLAEYGITDAATTSHAASHAAAGSDPITVGTVSGRIVTTTTGGKLATSASISTTQVSNETGVSLSSLNQMISDVASYGSPYTISGSGAMQPVAHVHAAGDITSGTVATARLASGTASSSTYLRGDQTWATVSSYTLPAATTSALGGVIVGTGLSVSSGTVSANVVSVAGRTGTVTIAHSDVGNAPATLTQFTAAQDNLSLGTGGIVRISSNAAVNITGFAATSGGDARMLSNVGSFAITLKHSDAASTAANRILCVGNADVVIAAGGSAVVYYDATDSRWRVG